MKNIDKLDYYFCPEQLIDALEKYVNSYNRQRYHESLDNVTPADVCFGKREKILQGREKIMAQNMNYRRVLYLTQN